MGGLGSRGSAERFASYLDGLARVIGHAARVGPLRDYCTGLPLPCERKSVEPIAAATAPGRVGAQHQALLHFVAEGVWSDEVVLAKVRDMVLPQIERHGAIRAWIIDDTSFPKHGAHSVGVTHQYCGELGKQANCQTAVSLSIANTHASLPVAYRLYLGIAFQTKPKIALDQLAWACACGLPRGVVLMDSAYGTDASLRRGTIIADLNELRRQDRHLPASQAGIASAARCRGLQMAPPDREPLLQAQGIQTHRYARRQNRSELRRQHPPRRSRDKLPINLNRP